MEWEEEEKGSERKREQWENETVREDREGETVPETDRLRKREEMERWRSTRAKTVQHDVGINRDGAGEKRRQIDSCADWTNSFVSARGR